MALCRRFGSTDPFVDTSPWHFRMGRPLANEAFLRALLRYGSFDTYEFFLADAAAVTAWCKKVRPWLDPGEAQTRVRATAQTELTGALLQRDFAVFHQGDFTYFMPHLVALRNALGGRGFAVSGVTHSLDNLHARFLQLSLCGLRAQDGIVCTSRAAEAFVAAKFAEMDALLTEQLGHRTAPAVRTTCIPLGVDDALFCAAAGQAERRAAARLRLRLPPSATVFLALGRLSVRSKNDWAPIFELWARRRATGDLDNVVVLLAGGCSPEGLQAVQALLRRFELGDQVRLLPNFSPAKKATLLQAADVCLAVVDNLQETFGLSVVEAMAAGLPVLAADYSGYRDSVVHGETGLLLPTLGGSSHPTCMQACLGLLDPSVSRFLAAQMTAVDLTALSQAMHQLHGEPSLRLRLGAAARRRAEAFRWPRLVRAYEAFWQQLDAARPATPLPPQPGHAALLGGRGLAAYAGFTAHLLRPDSRLQRTEVGRRALRAPDTLTRYEDVAPLLPAALEQALLRHAEAPTQVAELRRCGRAAGARSDGDVDFQLGWLLKHGALRWLG